MDKITRAKTAVSNLKNASAQAKLNLVEHQQLGDDAVFLMTMINDTERLTKENEDLKKELTEIRKLKPVKK